MTLWKIDPNDKSSRDPNLIWRRLKINLQIKAEKRLIPHKPLDEQPSYDFAEFDSASRNNKKNGTEEIGNGNNATVPDSSNSTTFEKIPEANQANDTMNSTFEMK